MKTMKKNTAFDKMIKLYGPWNTWGRAQHIAYGLIRGVPYSKMERCSNDNPHSTCFEYVLWKLGAWPEFVYPSESGFHAIPYSLQLEAFAAVNWIKKEPRTKKEKEVAQ